MSLNRYARMLMLIGLAGCAVMGARDSVAWAQDGQTPVIVDVPPPRRSTTPQAQPDPDPNAILGVRIEDNGALITGPMNARRVYIPLDRADLPTGFRSLWAGDAALCASAVEADRQHPNDLPDGSLRIGRKQIVGRQTMEILQLFVLLPSDFTWDMLESGRRLVLPASRYQDATKVLAIFSGPDGKRGYIELERTADGDGLRLRTRASNETATRCSP